MSLFDFRDNIHLDISEFVVQWYFFHLPDNFEVLLLVVLISDLL